MTRKNLSDADVHDEIVARIDALGSDTEPQWGAMSAAQMLAHCAEVQEVNNGGALEGTPFYVKMLRGLIRKMVVSDKPYPKSTQTHPQYIMKSDKDFEAEKRRLLAAMAAFASGEGADAVHPLFGKMDRDDKGWISYKHLDHHLTQFGV